MADGRTRPRRSGSTCAANKRRESATAAADAPPPLASVDTRGLVALPSPILKLIFAFACDRIDGAVYIPDQLFPRKPMSLHRTMPRLLTVYKAWSRVIAKLVDEFNAATHTIRFRTGLPNELPQNFQEVDAKGGRIETCAPKYFFEHAKQLEVDWRHIFSCYPHLVRLDLSLVPLNSKHLNKILDAVSTHYRNLHALILPNDQDSRRIEQRPDFPGIMRQLFQALERWYQYQGANGGLLLLSVPIRREYVRGNEFAQPDEYLENVATFCPNIQYLHDWKNDYDYLDSCLCTLDTWHKLFSTCAQLRDFDWTLVPIDDGVLTIFAAYPKLELKKMLFACGNSTSDQEGYIS